MKMLIVYTKEGFFKFPYLFKDFSYCLDYDHILRVFYRDSITGHEEEHHVFMEWTHYVIERDY